MRARRIIIILILIVSSIATFAQKVHLKASNEPLSSVVKRLNTEVSYNNMVLSKYRVTVDKQFASPYQAILYLIKGKPLQVNKVAGVIIITEKKPEKIPKPKEKRAEYRYVVKKVADTRPIDLVVSLKEILITAKSHIPSLKGKDADESNVFNAITARAMPGYADNMVFNVLRMMPGIRASGEPSDELYVWGSSPGESCISYDGIPLFAMQSYNSNISYINPYMFDEVRYKRGILSADEGSQTGAKVDVVSDFSDTHKPLFKAMMSTMSINCFGAVPISHNWTVTMAYRHTLGGLFGGTTFDAYREKSSDKNHASGEHNTTTNTGTTTTSTTTPNITTITPEYKFQDVNINIAGKDNSNTTYKLSLYGAKDYLDYDNDSINVDEDHTSYFGGASAHINKTWNNQNRSELSSSFSELYSSQEGSLISEQSNINSNISNRVAEFNIKLRQEGFGKLHWLTAGAEVTSYRVDTNSVKRTALQPTLFANAKYHIKNLTIEGGLRTDLMSSGVKWQPRIFLKYQLLKYFTITSSWGIYHQYLIKDPSPIHENAYKFEWDINTQLNTYNTVAGIAFDKGNLNVSIEGYMKRIHHSIWVVDNQLGMYNFKLRGIDTSTKYNWRHGVCYASWSLTDDPRQTNGIANELKAGSILRFYPFTFSANYIFGSGYNSLLLSMNAYNSHDENKRNINSNSKTTYSRMDISASYEKQFKYFGITAGVSLINLFDTTNKKYITSWVARNYASSFYSQASRFTPILFFEIKL